MEEVSIDPSKEYSLTFLVRHGLFGNVKTYATARYIVMLDNAESAPILKAKIEGRGNKRSFTIEGKNLLAYLAAKPR